MELQEIETAAVLEAIDFPFEVENECTQIGIKTHSQDDSFCIDWGDPDEKPLMQDWLIKTYGESIKEHELFLVRAS